MRRDALRLTPQGPRSAAHARQSREDEVGGRDDIGAVGMPLARVDEQHLACSDLTRLHTIVEVQATAGDDQRDGDRVAMLGHGLAGLQAQTDYAHGTAVRDLLEAEWTRLVAKFRA